MNLTNTTISKILQMTPQGARKWKKENRPIILLLEKYFSKEDIEEFLDKGAISTLDSFNNNKTITNIEVLNEVSNLVRKQLEKKIRLDAIGTKTVLNIIEDYFKAPEHKSNAQDFSIFYKSIVDIQNYYAHDIVEIEIKMEKKNFKVTDKNREAVETELNRRKNYILDIVKNFFDNLTDSELFILLNDYKNLLDYKHANFYFWSKPLY